MAAMFRCGLCLWWVCSSQATRRGESALEARHESATSQGFPFSRWLVGGLSGTSSWGGMAVGAPSSHHKASWQRASPVALPDTEMAVATWPSLWRESLEGLELIEGDGDDVVKFRGELAGVGQGVTVYQVTPATEEASAFWRNEVAAALRFNGGDFAAVLASAEFEHPTRGETILLCRADNAEGPETLADLMSKDDRTEETVPLDIKVKILVEVLQGVETMARAGYIHTHLSPDAVLLSGDCMHPSRCHAQLEVFGYARNIKRPARRAGRLHDNDFDAERQYIAPEVAMEDSHGTHRDVWSLGVLFYELVHAGLLPLRMYDPYETDEEFTEYVALRFNIADDPDFKAFSKECPALARVLEQMLERDPRRRWGATHALRELRKVARMFPSLQAWVDASGSH